MSKLFAMDRCCCCNTHSHRLVLYTFMCAWAYSVRLYLFVSVTLFHTHSFFFCRHSAMRMVSLVRVLFQNSHWHNEQTKSLTHTPVRLWVSVYRFVWRLRKKRHVAPIHRHHRSDQRMTDHNNWQRKYSMPHTNSDTLDAQTHVEMRGSQLTTLLTAVCRYLCLLFACRVCPSHAISFSLILVLFALLLLRSVRMRPHIGFCSHVLFTTS